MDGEPVTRVLDAQYDPAGVSLVVETPHGPARIRFSYAFLQDQIAGIENACLADSDDAKAA